MITNVTMPKLIPVKTGNFAIVDDEDFDELSKRNWFNYGSCGLYAATSINGENVMMHRIIMMAEKPLIVDHINNNSFDNRRSNLRICLGMENNINVRKALSAKNDRVTTSKYKGVSFRGDRQRWTAYVGSGKDRTCLGCFSSQEEAALAYNKAALAKWGEFAKLNVINDDEY
jgi:hypothetical protein